MTHTLRALNPDELAFVSGGGDDEVGEIVVNGVRPREIDEDDGTGGNGGPQLGDPGFGGPGFGDPGFGDGVGGGGGPANPPEDPDTDPEIVVTEDGNVKVTFPDVIGDIDISIDFVIPSFELNEIDFNLNNTTIKVTPDFSSSSISQFIPSLNANITFSYSSNFNNNFNAPETRVVGTFSIRF